MAKLKRASLIRRRKINKKNKGPKIDIQSKRIKNNRIKKLIDKHAKRSTKYHYHEEIERWR